MKITLKPDLIFLMIVEQAIQRDFAGSLYFSLDDFQFESDLRRRIVALAKAHQLIPLYIKIFFRYEDKEFEIQWQLPMTFDEWVFHHQRLLDVKEQLEADVSLKL